MARNKGNTKGITLIALVISIIVLLILAGITIVALSGNNGILKRATEAKNSTEISQEEESVKVAVAEALTQGVGTITTENLKISLTNNGLKGNLTGNGPWNYIGKYKSYTIEKSGKMTNSFLSEKSSDKIVDMIGEYGIAEDGTLWELEAGIQKHEWKELTKKRKIAEIGKVTKKSYYREYFIVTDKGELYSWKDNDNDGESEIGNEEYQNRLEKVEGVSDVDEIYVNYFDKFVKTKMGEIYAWGENYSGQLGIGNKEDQSRPVKVEGISNVEEIYTNGSSCVFAKTKTGELYAWGSNYSGELGIGNEESQSRPVKVTGISNIEEIYTNGDSSIFAKTKTGEIYAWGDNSNGRLGIGNNEGQNSPVKVTGVSNVEKIYTSYKNTLAKTKTGEIYAWGENDSGQLGIGNNEKQNSPVRVTGIPNVEEIYTNGDSSFVKVKTGEIYAWGENYSGQLGIGNDECQNSPVKVTGISNVEYIDIEGNKCFVKTLDGKVYVTGSNYGRLGLVYDNDYDNVKILNFVCWNDIKGLYGNNQKINKILTEYKESIIILTEDDKIYGYGYHDPS